MLGSFFNLRLSKEDFLLTKDLLIRATAYNTKSNKNL